MKKIIFICTGNICRSPMAQYYMQKKIIDIGCKDEYLIDSCGIYSEFGQGATNNAILAIKEYNVDMQNHKAKGIYDVDLAYYDLVICLTQNHKRTLLSIFPKLHDRIFTLKEYVNTDNNYKDIDDPWGYDLNIYRSCAKEIVENVDKLIKKF